MDFRIDGQAFWLCGAWSVTPGQVFNLLDVQFAPLKNVIESLTLRVVVKNERER